MARAVVFKTKGKLDLRSLTVFGMNAKPTTTTPIGYFGTGLKYAVAVLSRERIPITFWIDGKKWTVEQDETKFRDKEFRALTLKRHSMIPKTINLPFTTELGKNWELWQAFRELESNTRDEKGSTQVGMSPGSTFPHDMSGHTFIEVESEDFVQEFYDRDKTFLPEGLTVRSSNERIQCFAQKSNYIYYRSIRIVDLKEPSANTYNILSPIELTEDRTAKSSFDVNWEIEKFIAEQAEPEIVKRAVTAPTKTYERALTYAYASKSPAFMEVVGQNKEAVNPIVRTAWEEAQPKKVVLHDDWRVALVKSLEQHDDDTTFKVVVENAQRLITLLEKDMEDDPPEIPSTKEASSDSYDRAGHSEHVVGDVKSVVEETKDVDADIPF